MYPEQGHSWWRWCHVHLCGAGCSDSVHRARALRHEGSEGRYRNGAYSDIWTDVRRCADRTFLAYAGACECGWRGADHPSTEAGHHVALQDWRHDHFVTVTEEGSAPEASDFLSA